MANIKVHVLNFHSIFSHIEIVLENTSTEPSSYYGINRWDHPRKGWSKGGPNATCGGTWHPSPTARLIDEASSVYSFDINADPDQIVNSWKKYYNETDADASILGNNCAVAAQWFLTEFAGIPKPSLANVSYNHLAVGIVWPSFIPCPVTLPGRIMSNAKFYIEARDHPEVANKYSKLFIYTSLALATLAFSASIFALSVAATVLTGGLAGVAIAAMVATAVASSYGFFKAHNLLSAQHVSSQLNGSNDLKKMAEPLSLTQEADATVPGLSLTPV